MKNNMDELLKAALTPMDAPDEKLNNQILSKTKERDFMKNKYQKKKLSVAACFAVCVLVMGSVTAVAAYRYLSPKDVAVELEDNKLEQAFQSEDAIYVNETQEGGGYRVTLLGSVAGENISNFLSWDENNVVEADKIYTVLAIEHADGTPMPDTSSDEYREETFLASHYVQGLSPVEYNIMSMGGCYSEIVREGIQYRLIEMHNIEMFADREIYVGISSGTFYDVDAYWFDEETGKINRNEEYEGLNALFTLPIDKSKANSEAAKAYLESMNELESSSDGHMEMNATDLSVDEYVAKLTPENINEYAQPIESTRQICTVNEEGRILFFYELENGTFGQGNFNVNDRFPDMSVGTINMIGYNYSEGMEDLCINTIMLNEDGTYTFVVYMPKI